MITEQNSIDKITMVSRYMIAIDNYLVYCVLFQINLNYNETKRNNINCSFIGIVFQYRNFTDFEEFEVDKEESKEEVKKTIILIPNWSHGKYRNMVLFRIP